MRLVGAAVAAMIALIPAQSLAYDMTKSLQDRDDCSSKGTTFPSSIAAACSRLIENADKLWPGLEDDVDLYYLYRALAYDDSKKKAEACADVTKALELMPNAKQSRQKWMPLAKRVKADNCG